MSGRILCFSDAEGASHNKSDSENVCFVIKGLLTWEGGRRMRRGPGRLEKRRNRYRYTCDGGLGGKYRLAKQKRESERRGCKTRKTVLQLRHPSLFSQWGGDTLIASSKHDTVP